ncbi:AAA domain-containing protein [Crossiella sp. CA198]|uniref:AAA domain-containing protein n=1 Tax=Crossiella sp. CA198 TaxID=3455607 RepID=UPI003F8D2942
MSTTVDTRIEAVRRRAEDWADELIDLSHRNTLLRYKDSKTGTVDLTEADPAALTALFGLRKTKLGLLLTDPEAHKKACASARTLRRKIIALQEEQGVEAGYLANGLLCVEPPVTRGTTPVQRLRAPLLMQSVEVHARTAAETDFTLELTGEAEINPVLLYALNRDFGVDIDAEEVAEKITALLAEIEDPIIRLERAYQAIAEITGQQRLATTLEKRVLLGVFSFDKLPMVRDLQNSIELLAEHDIIAAAAGYAPAIAALREVPTADGLPDANTIRPAEEFLVQDTDSSQQRAITAALAGKHAIIEGPPGTGKSQTIANVIAGMAARGKRVLFVAEKRAAIEAVTQRLAQVGLDGLVFDLHEQRINRKRVAQQISDRLDEAGRVLSPQLGDLHERLVQRRSEAQAHPAELHQVREPWGVSAFDIQCRLLDLPAGAASRVRFGATELARLTGEDLSGLVDAVKNFVDLGGPRVRRGESPWSRSAVVSAEEVRTVLASLHELAGSGLREARSELRALVGRAGLRRPDTMNGWQDTLALLNDVTGSVAAFTEKVFSTELDRWRYATADRRWRKANRQPIGFWARRALCKEIRSMSQQGLRERRSLHEALNAAVNQRDRWRAAAVDGGEPASVFGLAEATQRYARWRDQLAAVSLCARLDNVDATPTAEVDDRVAKLRGDVDTLHRMPELNALTARLESLGLGQLLDEVTERAADPATAEQVFRWAWLTSVLEELKLRVPRLARFAGAQHSRLVEEFRTADEQHRRSSADRVRRVLATRLREVSDAQPDQRRLVRDQAARKRGHMSLRRLVEKSSDVLLAAFPCWAMSPLVVSRVLPAAKLFDLVIFDEASQVEPHDAMASIMRGRRLVVAGDDKQLPPSDFFRRTLSGADTTEDEEDEGDLRVYESILERLKSLIPDPDHYLLRWHYRSRDERLIAFSNKEIYQESLVTFPGAQAVSPLSLHVVDGVARPGQDGSAVAEVDEVVRLVLAHAEQRPAESLGVIAMSQKHADRIDAALRAARPGRPELDGFFSDEKSLAERFFVKNLERVQGDERDAIILSIGYAKKADGRLPMTFGPVNKEGGQRRLNVAVTRAKRRMSVVSSFSHLDLDQNRTSALPHPGVELLRRFLAFAATGGELDLVGTVGDAELNGFERAVLHALVAAGVPVTPQWGVSDYRIDFALAHPDQPGRMVLAVETDGERYHRAHTARDRDRLRQNHLEQLGWRFHRLWSTEWFRDPAAETERITRAWRQAVAEADRAPDPRPAPVERPVPAPENGLPRGERPDVPSGFKIAEYSDRELLAVARWLLRDGLERERDTRLEEVMRELGFQRRGKNIVDRINLALAQAQTERKRRGL